MRWSMCFNLGQNAIVSALLLVLAFWFCLEAEGRSSNLKAN